MASRGKSRLEFHSPALAKILRSDAVADWVDAAGQRAADELGDGFEPKRLYGFDRVSTIVRPVSPEAFDAVREDSTILASALGAVRRG
ncbi:hypothetical protein [Rathayibacter sp. VKM Ac-2630]|uniref:hypothetical protein n=1 Tax=Rathayibacter sp. VKM Ac-2630 TaxID=1938617 RepID=UPI0009809A51|nr:hypothetical protein [Rathayibacter sp. VKM Ac-2630]OOB90292.1 hypothetical protein B0T42_12380 [Rathayibacter sp. VKM Ac-2630]